MVPSPDSNTYRVVNYKSVKHSRSRKLPIISAANGRRRGRATGHQHEIQMVKMWNPFAMHVYDFTEFEWRVGLRLCELSTPPSARESQEGESRNLWAFVCASLIESLSKKSTINCGAVIGPLHLICTPPHTSAFRAFFPCPVHFPAPTYPSIQAQPEVSSKNNSLKSFGILDCFDRSFMISCNFRKRQKLTLVSITSKLAWMGHFQMCGPLAIALTPALLVASTLQPSRNAILLLSIERGTHIWLWQLESCDNQV